MQQLREGFVEEYDCLEQNWSEYARLKESIDHLHERIMSATVLESERLRLNIGGKRFEIRESMVKNNAYFRSLRNPSSFSPSDADGFYFINRDPDYIPVVMRYLRCGRIALGRYSALELKLIREEGEFYMLHDLVAEIDAHVRQRQFVSGHEIAIPSSAFPTEGCECVTGIFLEIEVLVEQMQLSALAFLAGERRKIVSEAHYKEGGIDSPGQLVCVGRSEQQAGKRDVVTVALNKPQILSKGLHTVGIYSASGTAAIMVLRRKGGPMFSCNFFAIRQTYHTTNAKGLVHQRAEVNTMGFCGKLVVSTV